MLAKIESTAGQQSPILDMLHAGQWPRQEIGIWNISALNTTERDFTEGGRERGGKESGRHGEEGRGEVGLLVSQ